VAHFQKATPLHLQSIAHTDDFVAPFDQPSVQQQSLKSSCGKKSDHKPGNDVVGGPLKKTLHIGSTHGTSHQASIVGRYL
jgi:hypothetical protein